MTEKKQETHEKKAEASAAESNAGSEKHDIASKMPKESAEELKEIVQRLQAEFENYRKRAEREKQQVVCTASSSLIRQLLPVVDNFEAALQNKENSAEFAKGIEMIYLQLASVLESQGLKKIESEGKKFDPYIHEALMQQESDKEAGIVIEEFQKGYTLNGTVIRHSKVKVSQGAKKA